MIMLARDADRMLPPDKPLHGAPFPHDRLHPSLYLAEFAGTALLISIGVSAVIIMFGQGSPVPRWLPNEGARRFMTGALFGLTGALIAVSPLGRISGAHINPAVTLAFWLEGKLSWRDGLFFVLAQLTGAAFGATMLLAWRRIGGSIAYGTTERGAGIPISVALVGEVCVTFLLILTIFVSAAHLRTRRFTPWTMPILFSTMAWLEGPISGTSANPARSFGPALIAGIDKDQWIYFLGPAIGSSLAIGFIRLQLVAVPRVTVARLFHFHLG
jgi:aquaporin Z